MKKLLALVLAMLMILGATCAMADDGYKMFDAEWVNKLIDEFGMDNDDWDTEFEKATLTVMLSLDYVLAQDTELADYDIYNAYLGYEKADDMYMVLLEHVSNGNTLLLMFDYETKTAAYAEAEVSAKLVAESSDFASANFEKVDSDEVQSVIDAILKGLSDD